MVGALCGDGGEATAGDEEDGGGTSDAVLPGTGDGVPSAGDGDGGRSNAVSVTGVPGGGVWYGGGGRYGGGGGAFAGAAVPGGLTGVPGGVPVAGALPVCGLW